MEAELQRKIRIKLIGSLRYRNPLLEQMAKLAREGRLKNMSSGEIVGQAIRAKVVLTEFPERSEWCDNGQMVDKHNENNL